MLVKYFLLKKFCDKNRSSDTKSTTNKTSSSESTFKINKYIPIKIYKKNDSYYLSFKEICEKNKFIGVLLSRRIRAENPRIWNNIAALGVL